MKQIKKNNSNRNWRNIYLLGAVSFFNDFSSEMIYPLIPVFINSVLGLGVAFIGIIEGIAETTNSLIKFNKRKAFIIAGYTISNLLRPLIGIVSSWGGLLFLRFSDRVGKGIRTAPRDALIGDCSPAQRRGFAFGFHRSMDHLGAVVGSLVASLILYVFLLDIRKVFLLSIIPGIIAILIIIFGVKEVTRKINGQKQGLDTNAIKGENSDT
jgi:sugar phosphate permease